VFLSQNDIGKPITNSGIIAGGDINIQAQNIINSSNLVSGGSIVITADGGTFTNSSGALISNNNINITANNILFNSITNTGNYTNNPNDTTNSYTQIIGSSNIIAGGNLSLISNNTTTLLGTNITSDSLNITSTNDILIGSMQSINNINLGEDYYSYNTSSISSNIIVNNNISITSTNGSFTLEAGEDKEDTHSFTSSSGFMSSTTTTSDYYSLTHNSSNIISNNGNITINVNNNINILGSNISSGNDITLTTTEGDVNILSLINQEYSQVHSVSQGLLSGEVSIVGHSSQSIHQSSITSNNNLTINSSNNINILASNVNGVNGNLDANGNVNILSMMLTDTQTNYHKEQSVDWGAVALAVGVGALSGGAGAMLGAHLISASLLTAGIAGAGIGASTGLLIGGQVHQGELDKYTTTTTTHVSSVLNFTNNLTITSDKDVNLVASTINANAVEINAVNFNQIDGENINTTEHTHQEMKPNYTNLSGVVGALGFASGIKGPLIQALTSSLGAGTAGKPSKPNEDENKPKPPITPMPTIDENGTLLEMTGEALQLAVHLYYPQLVNQVWDNLPDNNLTAEQNAGLLILAQMLFPKPPTNIEEEGNKPMGTGVNINISLPPKPTATNQNGSFTILPSSFFDIDKPLQTNNLHQKPSQPQTTITTEKEKVEATINANSIIINTSSKL
jgi:hypothetical protein